VIRIFLVGRRDLAASLVSFPFYLLVAVFLGVSGYFFWSGLSYFSLLSFQAATNPQAQISGLNLTEGVMSPYLANLSVLLLLLIPILSMRSFAEEKKQGTLELLFSYPVSELEVVIGKFLGLFGTLLILVLPTVAYFFLAQAVGAAFEVEALLAGYGGLLLVGASFIAFGMFISSLTEHQSVSAGVGFVLLLFFWIVGWMADWTSPALGVVFRELALTEHFMDLTRGIVDTRDVGFFVLFITFFLFATLCSLEVRTWRK
jgi:ABC-2 type transport system permease protein